VTESGSEGEVVGLLKNNRVVVIGASSGIGRALVATACREGARVVAAARRMERLEELATECPGALPLACDVRDGSACRELMERSVEALGGLDAIVYCVGQATLSALESADAELWRHSVDVNLIGASLVTAAALPHLVESRGKAVFLSSIAADDDPPRPGLGLYVCAKAALNKLVVAWQAEHREVGFTRVSVGDTGATEMASEWDPSVGSQYVAQWVERGYLFGQAMLPDAVARHLVSILASEEHFDVVRLTPRYAVDS
jgi:NADP-dependent 3-hydroxy acid dehydrogenase YdfG